MELALFQDGARDFNTVDVAPELGPIFNGPAFNDHGPAASNTPAVLRTPAVPTAESCATCHRGGGSNGSVEMRFGRTDNDIFDALTSEGGSLLQFFAVPGGTPELLPADANTFALRRTTTVQGAGLIEAIPDEQIISNAMAEPDGQAGEVVMVDEPDLTGAHVGRFGWKCQHASLFAFAGDAYLNEMGVSNTLFPEELAPNGAATPVTAVKDQPTAVSIPGQTLMLTDIQRFYNFMRYLPLPLPQQSPHLVHGAQVFNTIGCAVCHTQTFTTSSSVAALDQQKIHVWSDFLLHDVGTGDGIVQGAADTANKLRTAPLIGVAGKGLMHDAGSATVQDAIQRHQNQGQASTDAFNALNADDQQAVVDFVNSL
jgi:CxxC motif-containing protein (DUF1111 family)